MKINLFAIVIFLNCCSLSGQVTVERILTDIEKNNTGIIALGKKVEADQIGNRIGIYPSNPEFEFNYLYGSPSEIGNRTDISIYQTIDFPTAYAYKNRIADSRNIQAELEYQKELKSLLYRARMLCIDIIHTNALKKEYDKRLTGAQNLASSYKTRLEKGEGNILEYNKAQLNLLNLRNEAERISISRNSLLSELAALNGGIPVSLDDTELPAIVFPDDFESWYLEAERNNPVLSWLKNEIEIIDMQRKLSVAERLPKLSAGYMSEKVVGQQFQGVTAGLSIPLWENKNTVKYAKARALAVSTIDTDSRLVFYNQLKIQFRKATDLQKSVTDYRLSLESFDSSALLKKALDMGEISLSEYLFEISMYYESIDRLLYAEKELNEAYAGLTQYSGKTSSSF
jgi:outer membrane protein TolC